MIHFDMVANISKSIDTINLINVIFLLCLNLKKNLRLFPKVHSLAFKSSLWKNCDVILIGSLYFCIYFLLIVLKSIRKINKYLLPELGCLVFSKSSILYNEIKYVNRLCQCFDFGSSASRKTLWSISKVQFTHLPDCSVQWAFIVTALRV